MKGLADQANTPPPEPDVVRTVRRRALGRQWKHLARERLKDAEPTIPLGRKFWALDREERAALASLSGRRRSAASCSLNGTAIDDRRLSTRPTG